MNRLKFKSLFEKEIPWRSSAWHLNQEPKKALKARPEKPLEKRNSPFGGSNLNLRSSPAYRCFITLPHATLHFYYAANKHQSINPLPLTFSRSRSVSVYVLYKESGESFLRGRTFGAVAVLWPPALWSKQK